jgi:hypothetical protein
VERAKPRRRRRARIQRLPGRFAPRRHSGRARFALRDFCGCLAPACGAKLRRLRGTQTLLVPSRFLRGLLSLGLALLLLSMEQETLRHALSHFKPAPEQPEFSSQQSDGPCVKCALLTADSAAAPVTTQSLLLSLGEIRVTLPAYLPPLLARSTSHRSRAPPFLS